MAAAVYSINPASEHCRIPETPPAAEVRIAITSTHHTRLSAVAVLTQIMLLLLLLQGGGIAAVLFLHGSCVTR
jgi:hypothetical protein